MKILMITDVPNTLIGGAARIMHHLSDEMIRQGHHVDLIFSEDIPAPFGRRLTNLTSPFFMLFPIRRLTRVNGPYDILAVHSLLGAVYVALRKIRRRLPRCILMSYGSDELRWQLEKEEDELGLRPLPLHSKLLYYNLVIRQARFATQNADHVITAAHSEKTFYTRNYRMNPEAVSVIPNGVSLEFFMERNYGRVPTALLFFGGWEWRKGTRYLVETFSKIAERHPHVTLSLAGTGDGPEIVLRSFPVRIHSRIRVIPTVSAEVVPSIYAQHDIFVFPSLFESMSLVVPEAMASGMPVVTTRACGMQDIVEDEATGFLVSPRDVNALTDRVDTLLRNSALCERLGRAAQQKARLLTWDRIASQTIQTYEKILHA